MFYKKNKTIPKKYLENIKKYGLATNDLLKKFMKFEKINLTNNDIENKKSFELLNFKENTLPSDIKFSVNVNPNDKDLFKKYLHEYIFKNDFHGVLQQEDRLSMANSIETRIPFADHKFMEYIFSIDEKYFMKDGIGKYMLRTSFNKKYPKKFPKFKAKVPKPGKSNNIIYDQYYEKFADLLSSSNMKTTHFDNKLILKKFIRGKNDLKMRNDSLILFRILSYLIWIENNVTINKVKF
jgi:asparagine synthetase B (glutamine-hydrolysing)